MKKLFGYLTLLLSLICLVGCEEQQLKIGKVAPDIAVKNAEGKIVKLSEFKDKPILLDFWSKNCGACIYSIPILNEIQNKYADKIIIISIGVDLDYEKLTQYAAEHKANYIMTSDQLGITQEKYQVMGYPTFFLLNKDHMLDKINEGISPDTKWAESLEHWINQQYTMN